MNNDLILALRRQCDFNSLLVSTPKGLKRKHCPFSVTSKYNLKLLKKGAIYEVQFIAINKKLELQYVVNKRPYPYYLFSVN